ncbi:MAG: ATP synthase F0 subunit B [Candidatus Eisenbacteria bacterium RBG_16_71_46]|nr:MAG: ATP synthase F0 subunit B [Candidatus Eisenbacteria bacterium RBG_16_71_46]OGF24490.1 MAG: ATP synthase F0 subunit B [Candidatus Eisenbacteria bacterium RBG_19FT_COMBO_70_11]
MNLIDIRQVVTQALGFLLLVWVMRRWAWTPLLGMLDARRERIAAEFREAERLQAEAQETRGRYEQELRGIEAQARLRLNEAVTEGQRVAAEMKTQAQQEAARRLQRAEEDIGREREKAKELLKAQVVHLSIRTAEKILRQKIDDATQRKLVGDFVDEVGTLR